MQSPLMMSGWPTTIGIGGPLPIVSLVVQSSFQKTAAHPPSTSIVSCNFRYIESSDGSVGTTATVSKKCREEVSLSLALFDLYTLHSPDWESFTSGGYSSASMYSGQFSPNSSSISLRLSSADQLLTAHSTRLNALSNTDESGRVAVIDVFGHCMLLNERSPKSNHSAGFSPRW